MSVALGVGLAVGNTVLATLGKQLISSSARAEDAKKARLSKVAGLVITTLVGPIVDTSAYAFAPQNTIAPLSGLDIVWNTLSAPYTLGERLNAKHVVGSTCVFLGSTLTAILGPHSETQATTEWLDQTFNCGRFASYCVAFGTLLGMAALVLKTRPKGVGDKARGTALGATAGGIAGNMFFISAGLSLFRCSASSGDWSEWSSWTPYAVLLAGVAVAISNVPFMTKALQEYEALFIVTLFEGCHILVACVSGAWVLREMHDLPFEQRASYWLSVSLIVCGLLVIQRAAAGKANARPPGPVQCGAGGNPEGCWSDNGNEDYSAPVVLNLGDASEHPAEHVGRSPSGSSASGLGSRGHSHADAGAMLSTSMQPPRRQSADFVVWASAMSGIGSAPFSDDRAEEGSSSGDSFTSDDEDMAAE